MNDAIHTSETAFRLRAWRGLQLLRFRPFDTSSEAGRSQERHRRAAIAALASAAAKATGLLATLVSVPLTVRYLSEDQYGLWMAISSVIAMFAFADLGIGNGLVGAIAEASGRGDERAIEGYISSAFFMLAALAGVLAIAFAAIYPFVPWSRALNVTTAAAARGAGPTMAALVACTLVAMPLGVVQRVQTGLQEGFANGLWQCAASAVGLAALIVAIRFRAGLPWLVLATSGAPLLAIAANGAHLFAWRHRALRPRLSLVRMADTRRISSTGFLFFVIQVAMAVGFSSDNVVIDRVLGAPAVTQYAVPFRLFSIPVSLLYMVVSPLWPAYGEAWARGDVAWAARTLKRSLRASVVLGAIASLALVLFGRPLLRIWGGPTIHPTSALLWGLGIWMLMCAYGQALAMFLNGINVIRFQAWTALAMAVVNLGLSIILARRMGVAGVVWGSVISYGVCFAGPVMLYVAALLRRARRHPSAAAVTSSAPAPLD